MNIGKYGYNAWYSKFDYVWNQNHRTTGSVSQNWGFEYRAGNGIQNSPAKSGNDPLRRVNYASKLDHVWGPNTMGEFRVGFPFGSLCPSESGISCVLRQTGIKEAE